MDGSTDASASSKNSTVELKVVFSFQQKCRALNVHEDSTTKKVSQAVNRSNPSEFVC